MASESTQKPDANWAPDHLDIFGGAESVVTAVRAKANVRDRLLPNELGIDAGRGVLDQYFFAKGEHSAATNLGSTFSFQNVTNLASMALPPVGMAAAIAVDMKIFGAAAKGFSVGAEQSGLPFEFNAFAFGSLIFATALGLSERNGNTVKILFLYGALVVACTGASFIAANEEELREPFRDTIANVVTTGSDAPQAALDALIIQRDGIKAIIDDKNNTLKTGGVNGLPMMADGKTGNDEDAARLQEEIRALETQLSGKNSEIAVATPQLEQAKRKDWVDLTARGLATAYIAAWLIAAQLLLAEIVRRSADSYKKLRETIAGRSRLKEFVKGIETADDEKRDSYVRAAVKSMLSRFSEQLSLSTPDGKHPNKHQNFASLFEGDNYDQMVEAGVGVVKGAVSQKPKSAWSKLKSSLGGLFNKASKAPENSAPQASAQPQAPADNTANEPAAEPRNGS